MTFNTTLFLFVPLSPRLWRLQRRDPHQARRVQLEQLRGERGRRAGVGRGRSQVSVCARRSWDGFLVLLSPLVRRSSYFKGGGLPFGAQFLFMPPPWRTKIHFCNFSKKKPTLLFFLKNRNTQLIEALLKKFSLPAPTLFLQISPSLTRDFYPSP